MTSASPAVRYAGAFHFRDRSALERALANVRSSFDALTTARAQPFEIAEPATLRIDLAFPNAELDRHAAAEMLAVLSREALEGSIVATVESVPVEYYSVKPWA